MTPGSQHYGPLGDDYLRGGWAKASLIQRNKVAGGGIWHAEERAISWREWFEKKKSEPDRQDKPQAPVSLYRPT